MSKPVLVLGVILGGLGLVLSFVLAMPVQGTRPAEVQASIVVDTLEDEDNADGDCALREAIRAANENISVDACPPGDELISDTITFEVSGTITLSIGQLEVTAGGPLAIDGGEAITVSGGGSARAFYVNSGVEITLSRLTVSDGNVNDQPGGGIYNDAGTVNIADCTLSDNWGNGGGGIYNHLGIVIITDSLLSHNDGYLTGGGGIYNDAGTVTVVDSTLMDNSGEFGGGIANSGTLTITHSSLSGNSALEGGGIYNYSGSLNIANSTLSSNNAGDKGGGIYFTSDTYEFAALIIANSTLSSNSAREGGGVFSGGSTGAIVNSTLSANSASELGGGISTVGSMFSIGYSTLAANSASISGGGGIYNHDSQVLVRRSIFAYSPSGGNCAGYPLDLNEYNIEDANTCNFDPTEGSLPDTDPLLGPLQDHGGPTLTHALLAGSPAIDAAAPTTYCPPADQRGMPRPVDGDGDGTAVCDIGAYEYSSRLIVNTLEDEDNADGDCALREAIRAANENISVDACPGGDRLITDTIAFAVNGTIPLSSGQLEVAAGGPLAIDGGEAITVSGGGSARAFYVNSGAQLLLENLTIADGHTPDEGGGIYNLGRLVVTGSRLTGNVADDSGGGIYNQGALTLTLSTIRDNETQNLGGGILNAGQLSISNSAIRDNQVTDTGNGGGIYNQGSLILSGSTIMNNGAYGMGGLGNTGSMTVTNVTVSGNLAAFTGGIGSAGSATLNNVTISNNTAVEENSAGGIEGEATLRNSIVADNPGGNCLGAITSTGYNLDSQDSCNFDAPGDLTNSDARLGSLFNNGGATLTHALLDGSPAIDTGSCTDSDGEPILIDQRGVARPQGAGCDIGAYEVEVPPIYIYLPVVRKPGFHVELVVTDSGFGPGYPAVWWVYGHLNNLVSTPVYYATIGIEETFYPYCYPDPCDPYETTEIVYPAFPATLPGQINPFSWSVWLGKAYITVNQVRVISESLSGGEGSTYYPLTILNWWREGNAVVGSIRNDSGEALVNARVVVVSDECAWKEAALSSTDLQPGEETDFRLDYFYCTGEDVSVIGQANSGP
jgi:CSLREA domain-containing protein